MQLLHLHPRLCNIFIGKSGVFFQDRLDFFGLLRIGVDVPDHAISEKVVAALTNKGVETLTRDLRIGEKSDGKADEQRGYDDDDGFGFHANIILWGVKNKFREISRLQLLHAQQCVDGESVAAGECYEQQDDGCC